MNFTLLSRKTLSDVPSASGIEVMGNSIYVTGDDSPWLFRLNEKLEVEEKFPIGDVSAAVNGKIPKPLKPDLEAMAAYGEDLLLFGSGSKSPQRDVLVQINTISQKINKYPLIQFYDALCASAQITRTDLNLEGAVIADEDLFLFNRGKNMIFKLNVRQLLFHVAEKNKIPEFEIFHITLPSLNNIEAGFSGASAAPGGKEIIFTASVENTPNWIDDGEILGSFVGLFSLDELKDSFHPDCIALTDSKKNILKIKVESVAVHHSISPDKMHIILVTDNDSSSSEIIEAELKR